MLNSHQKKVVIFGDSILKPVVLNDNFKYVFSKEIDWENIEKELNVKLENRCRMGATIKHGVVYISEYLKTNDKFFAAVIAYGGNDTDYNWRQVSDDGASIHYPNTKLDDFEAMLNEIIDLLNEKKIRPILVTLPPISSIKYFQWIMKNGLNEENIMRHLGDIETIARHQEMYNNVVLKIAYSRKIKLVDIRKEFLDSPIYMSLMCEDGIHPNTAGGQLIVDTFIKRFKQKTKK